MPDRLSGHILVRYEEKRGEWKGNVAAAGNGVRVRWNGFHAKVRFPRLFALVIGKAISFTTGVVRRIAGWCCTGTMQKRTALGREVRRTVIDPLR